MQHPDIRPSAWTSSGHGDVEATDIVPPILNATPKINRVGLKNWQIVHSAKELAEAKSAGKYTTKDGYIFDPADLLDPKVKIGSDHFRIPRVITDGYRRINKSDLSYLSELIPVEAMVAQREKATTSSTSATGSSEKPAATSTISTSESSTADAAQVVKETAASIFNRVTPKKIVPFEQLPYQSGYASEVKDVRLVIPHNNHNHYIHFLWFDQGKYQVPQGYSLEDFLATVKYYITHPQERPASSEGWGTVKQTVSEPTKVSESSESAVPSTQSSLSETDAQVTNETAETAPHTPTETTTKDATGAVVKESEENALADHATEDSARNIVDEKSIVPEKTKEKAHQESTAVSAVNNE